MGYADGRAGNGASPAPTSALSTATDGKDPTQVTVTQEIGARRKRVEDPRLVRGEGSYVDDLRLPGTVEAVFVRSGYGHARIRGVDLAAAQAAPGVVAV